MNDKKPKMTVQMACGHPADSYDDEGNIYCSDCLGGIKAWKVVDVPGQQRVARCTDCGKTEHRKIYRLAFYRFREDRQYDDYYCGCRGLSG